MSQTIGNSVEDPTRNASSLQHLEEVQTPSNDSSHVYPVSRNNSRNKISRSKLLSKDYFQSNFFIETQAKKLDIDFESPEKTHLSSSRLTFKSLEKRHKALYNAFHADGSKDGCEKNFMSACETHNLSEFLEVRKSKQYTSVERNCKDSKKETFNKRKVDVKSCNEVSNTYPLSPELKQPKRIKKVRDKAIGMKFGDHKCGKFHKIEEENEERLVLSRLNQNFEFEDTLLSSGRKEVDENNDVEYPSFKTKNHDVNKNENAKRRSWETSPDVTLSPIFSSSSKSLFKESKHLELSNCSRRQLFPPTSISGYPSETLTKPIITIKNSPNAVDNSVDDNSVLDEVYLSPELNKMSTSKVERRKFSRVKRNKKLQISLSEEISDKISSSHNIDNVADNFVPISPELGRVKSATKSERKKKHHSKKRLQDVFNEDTSISKSYERLSPIVKCNSKIATNVSMLDKVISDQNDSNYNELRVGHKTNSKLSKCNKLKIHCQSEVSCFMSYDNNSNNFPLKKIENQFNKVFNRKEKSSGPVNDNPPQIELVSSQAGNEKEADSKETNHASLFVIETELSQTQSSVPLSIEKQRIPLEEMEEDGSSCYENVKFSSSCRRRKRRYPQASLISRYLTLRRRYESNLRIWNHTMKWDTQRADADTSDWPIFRVKNLTEDLGYIFMECQRREDIKLGYHYSTGFHSLRNSFYILEDAEDSMNSLHKIVYNECFKVHPPWRILELQKENVLLLLSAARLESVEFSENEVQDENMCPTDSAKRIESCVEFGIGRNKSLATCLRETLRPPLGIMSSFGSGESEENQKENNSSFLFDCDFYNPDGLIGRSRVCRFFAPNFFIIGTLMRWDNFSDRIPDCVKGKYSILLCDSIGEICDLALHSSSGLSKLRESTIESLDVMTSRKYIVTGFIFTHNIPVESCWLPSDERIEMLPSQSHISVLSPGEVWNCEPVSDI